MIFPVGYSYSRPAESEMYHHLQKASSYCTCILHLILILTDIQFINVYMLLLKYLNVIAKNTNFVLPFRVDVCLLKLLYYE